MLIFFLFFCLFLLYGSTTFVSIIVISESKLMCLYVCACVCVLGKAMCARICHHLYLAFLLTNLCDQSLWGEIRTRMRISIPFASQSFIPLSRSMYFFNVTVFFFSLFLSLSLFLFLLSATIIIPFFSNDSFSIFAELEKQTLAVQNFWTS